MHFLFFLYIITTNLPSIKTQITLKLSRSESSTFQSSQKRFLQQMNPNIITLSNIFNIHYNVKVFIGKPPKEFNLILDTGSNWLWVGSDSCENCYSSGISDLYHCSNSISCIEDRKNSIDLHYGIGYVNGYITRDRVSFDKSGNLSVEDQKFIQIQMIQDINQLKGEGLLGIGKKGYETKAQSNFIENLMKQGKIEHNMFSLYLLGHECREDSRIVIGGYDESLFEGNITYVYGISDEMWNIPIESVFFSMDNIVKNIDSVYKTALIDSGSSEIVMNSTDLSHFINYFKSLGIDCELINNYQNVPQLTCDESDERRYPDFNIKINNTIFTIKPKEYFANCYFISFKYVCRLHFIVDNSLDLEEIIILGETFLNVYYSIYDLENNRIGLVKAIKYEEFENLSTKEVFFKVFALIIVSNILLFLMEFLCVNKRVCAKMETINFIEKLFRNFEYYPELLVEEINQKNEN